LLRRDCIVALQPELFQLHCSRDRSQMSASVFTLGSLTNEGITILIGTLREFTGTILCGCQRGALPSGLMEARMPASRFA